LLLTYSGHSLDRRSALHQESTANGDFVLLKRICTQLTDANWTAVFVELLVVAVGILMSLQAPNWNDDRIECILERDCLVCLHEDMPATAIGIERDNEGLVQ
jgi:hypothetical protein